MLNKALYKRLRPNFNPLPFHILIFNDNLVLPYLKKIAPFLYPYQSKLHFGDPVNILKQQISLPFLTLQAQKKSPLSGGSSSHEQL